MKRILLLFSALMLSCIALWAHDVEIDEIFYNLDEYDKTAEVTYRGNSYNSYSNEYSGSVVIPETITYNSTTYSVTSIGSRAFYGCSGLTSLTINSVTSIGSYAFDGCEILTKVNYLGTVDKWVEIDFENYYSSPTYYAKDLYINNELLTDVKITEADSIKNSAFYNCQSIKSVEIGESVTYIGHNTFYGCSGLTSVIWNARKFLGDADERGYFYTSNNFEESPITSFTIGEGVERIPDFLCPYLKNLTEIIIPSSVTSIGGGAFYRSGLTSLTIPNSVTSIDSYAFDGCENLTKVNYLGTVDKWVKFNWTYSSNPTFYAKDLYINNELLTDVKITTADSIKDNAFYNCQSIKSVEIGESVTYIGHNTFYGCSGLTSVIWNARKFLGEADERGYFYTSNNFKESPITSFTIGEGVERIPDFLCPYLKNLTEIIIPSSVTSIGIGAFYRSGLTSLTIPNSVTSIDSYAFGDCYGLTSVTIPNSVTVIGNVAFSGCSGLKRVNYLGTINQWAEMDFGYSSDNNPTFYAKDLYINNELLTDVKITTADSIKDNAFYNCQSIKSVEIGNSVTYIGSSAFYNCTNLKTVVNFSDLDIIKGESSHGYVAYYADWIGTKIEGDFIYDDNDVIIDYIGDVNISKITIPSKVKGINANAFVKCKNINSIVWNAKNCSDFSSTSSPFYNIRSQIISFIISNEVKTIPSYLCYGMKNLKEVTIPTSVTSIGSSAFSDCSKLTAITIPNSVTSIGSNSFTSCSDLTSIVWNAKKCSDFSNTSSPFYNIRSQIKSFTFGDEVETIPAYLCNGMSSLKEVTFPGSVRTIGKGAFSDCSGFTSISIGDNITSINETAFSNCTYLKTIYIGEKVSFIDKNAFSSCNKLNRITVYSRTVPTAYQSSFAHYNAYLYVFCDIFEDYDLDAVFGSFKYIKCIAAEEVDAPDKVEIEVDEDDNANVIWPSTDGAKKYELEISKDGEVFCTLVFNENGQLTSIDFGNRSASVGFQFTVTGLDGASKYAYSMVAMDKKGNELQSYKGTFTTNGYVPGPGEEDKPTSITETLADANITVSGGTISADADFSIYNTIGQDVTSFNGSLQPGVYLVSIENNIVKVMVK